MIVLDRTYTYDELLSLMKQLSRDYCDFAIYRVIGESHDNRLIPMLRIGTGEQTLICTAGMHGRESVNPILMVKVAEEYCKAYRSKSFIAGYDLYALLNKYSIILIPLMNPDGYEIALHDFEVIHNPVLRQMCKMKHILPQNWKYNARGVDINRNFPSKTYIQQQFYEHPGSENETRALMRVFRNYDSVGYVDFHSRGKIIYYYRQVMPFIYNQKSQRLARHLQEMTSYTIGRREEEFTSTLSGGHSVHYFSETTGNPAITVETVEDDATYPLDAHYQSEAYREIQTIPLGILEMA